VLMSISVGGGMPKPPVYICHPRDSEPSVARHFGASITGGWSRAGGRNARRSGLYPMGREFGCCAMAQLRQERSRVLRSSLREKAPKSASPSRSLPVNELIRSEVMGDFLHIGGLKRDRYVLACAARTRREAVGVTIVLASEVSAAAAAVSGPPPPCSPRAPRRCFRLLDRRQLATGRRLDARSAPSSVSTDGRAKRRSQVVSRRRLQCCWQMNV
jgi:hypothetical protein